MPPPKSRRLAGKAVQGTIIRALWAPRSGALLFFAQREKYCHNGGHGRPDHPALSRRRAARPSCWGSMIGIAVPIAAPSESAALQEK